MGGGEIAWINGYDDSRININAGDISWLKVYEDSVTNISFVDDLSWLLLNDDAKVNIYGTDFSYANGHLAGTWANGSNFSFWALNQTTLNSGNINDIFPDTITLHSVSVPEPSSVALFMICFAELLCRKTQRS